MVYDINVYSKCTHNISPIYIENQLRVTLLTQALNMWFQETGIKTSKIVLFGLHHLHIFDDYVAIHFPEKY